MKDILELARQAGFYVESTFIYGDRSTEISIEDKLQAFATLVRSAALEEAPVATVLLHKGEKIIDGSMAFMDSALLGTQLYTHPSEDAKDAAMYRWLRDNTELDELDELVFEIDKPDWDSAIDESIKEHHGINELRKAAQTLESYCLGYTHSKCETCQQQANWLALNQFPNELFQAMKFSAQRISDDGCRLTNMGAYVPMGEQP